MPSEPPTPQRVLVIDDNVDLAENVAELFADAGCAARTANGVEQALAALEAEKCDLAIVDIRLETGSGVDLASAIRRRWPDAEVILMTANASLDTAIAAIQGEAFAYVQKPFDSGELLALGQRALGQVQLRRERARLERDLSQSEALHRSVVDAVDAFIVGLRPGGEVRMWNRSAESCTELPGSAVLGKPFAALLVSDRAREQLERALERALDGDEIGELELPVRAAHGPQRIVRWHLSRLPDHGGEPLVLAVGVDHTNRIELERRAAEAEAMASLGTLTTGLAHEIRNPLNAATLQLELLQRGADKLADAAARDAIAERVRIVREELSRLARLLDDFLRLARPRAIEQRTVDLRSLVTEISRMHAPAAQQAGVSIELDLEDGPLEARGDAALLKQVLVNLVNNAIEAMREQHHGRLVLGCHRKGETRVELSVEDDGPGIPEAIGDRLFAPFVTSKEAGTGLGLTIVKRIVERHGGAIHVASTPGHGAQIWVTLPGAA